MHDTLNSQLSHASDVDLFLDESGSFPSLYDPEPEEGRSFPSQVAGFLAPAASFGEAAAQSLLERIFSIVDHPLPEVVHGTEFVRDDGPWGHLPLPARLKRYGDLISALVHELKQFSLQPVRLVNRERIHYAERIDSQLNITAELVTQIADRLAGEGHSRLLVRVHPAQTTVPTSRGRVRIDRAWYADALEVQTSLALARRGLPANSWRAEVGEVEPAHVSRRLQIADLISHASHDNFHPCRSRRSNAKQLLQQILSRFDFTLAMPLVLEHVEHCLEVRALGSGIQAIAERVAAGHCSEQFLQRANRATSRLLDSLIGLPVSSRDNHLNQLLAWVEQIVQQRRDLDLGILVIRWLLNSIETPMRARVAVGEVEWFAYGLRAWWLTALNHKGSLIEAQPVAAEMDSLANQLAGRWEHSPTLLGGLITIAVHETDRRDFAAAGARAEAVANYYGTLGDLFGDALPKVFPEVIKSSLRGKALGTAVQAYLLDSDRDIGGLIRARELSDKALIEFLGSDDVARQRQYRSHIEARAGDFSLARKMLALSLKRDVSDHQTIAAAIAALPLQAQGFPLLHWWRIGAQALLAGDEAEASDFLKALEHSGLRRNAWCHGQISSFPAHGILRFVATVEGYGPDPQQSVSAVDRLASLKDTREAVALALILAATICTVAALVWPSDASRARSLVFSRTPGTLVEIIEDLQRKTVTLPQIGSLLREWTEMLERMHGGTEGKADSTVLLAMAQRVVT